MSRPLTFKSASVISLERLAAIFTESFSGYLVPLLMDTGALAGRARIEQHDLFNSLLAYDSDELAGIAILAVRGERGWVGGFGVVPAQRGRGRGRELMKALLERARACGLRQLSLEVLARNEAALRLYERAGMRRVRDLLIMERPARPSEGQQTPTLKEAAPAELLKHFARLHGQPPAWQRDLPSLLVRSGMLGLYLGEADAPEAYALMSEKAGDPTSLLDLAAIGVKQAESLCVALNSRPEALRVVNEPEQSPMVPSLLSQGFRETERQHEMLIDL
jgi:ribosomal protein S18 acetylase RimI-like enzyme